MPFILKPMLEIVTTVRARRLTHGQGRRLRLAADLSVAELAEVLHVDPGTLSRWERGLVRPRGEAASRWLQACEEIRTALDGEVLT